MADLSGFNANEVEPQTGFEPIPAGKYLAAIVASEMKPTKNGKGHYLEMRFQLLEGEHKNRTLFARLNLDNPNETAVEIAQRELSAICRAVNCMTPQDSTELHDIPLTVAIKCVKRKDNGEITNEIGGYSSRNEVTTATSSSEGNSDSAPPWKR